MAVSFPGFPWRFWSGGSKDKHPVSKGSSLNSSSPEFGLGLRESETAGFQTKIAPAKGKGKWQGSVERSVVDKECDVVIAPSDGLHLSGYETDGPEWSIGWEEPYGPGFQVDDEDDGGFAVLVPCYRLGCRKLAEGSNNQLLSAIKCFPNGFSSEKTPCMFLAINAAALLQGPKIFHACCPFFSFWLKHAEGSNSMQQWFASLQNF